MKAEKMDKTEEKFLLLYMGQTWEEMRHLENLRERVSVLMLTIASIISGFVVQQKFSPETKIMVWFVIVLGIVGIIMGLKIFQIHQMGQKRLDKWNEYLESKCGDSPKILELRKKADLENKKDFKLVSKIPHNFFWTILYIFIIGIGIVMLTMIKDNPDVIKKPDLSKSMEVIENTKTNYSQKPLHTDTSNNKPEK